MAGVFPPLKSGSTANLDVNYTNKESGMRPKIAVVEDNADSRLLMEWVLNEEFEIAEYETGKQAIDGLLNNVPDLILLDISLPALGGPEVLRWIRSQESLRNLPVIALTAHAMAGDREKYLELGFDNCLTKPVLDEDLLFAVIEGLLPR